MITTEQQARLSGLDLKLAEGSTS